MIHDPLARSINDFQPLIGQLAEQERLIAEARRKRDQAARRSAEDRTRALRSGLLENMDASLAYLYLAASGEANNILLQEAWQDNVVRKPDAVLHRLREWNVEDLYQTYWANPSLDLSILPGHSFSLSFTFTLAQPYISKDDNPIYIVDNPIVRDKVFQLPLVRSSSWKGSLAAALRQLGQSEKDATWQRLFGKVNEANDEGQAGRLVFFPTFFTQTSLEIINPHDRKSRVGKNPILFECVPIDAKGTFTVLYVPFDRVGEDEKETRQQAAQDLTLIAEGARALFTIYGFGAKTSSGYGIARQTVKNGVLSLRMVGLQPATSPMPAPPAALMPDLPRYLDTPGQLKPEYRTANGGFHERSDTELKAMKKADRLLYDKAKAWWEREGKRLAGSTAVSQIETAAVPAAPEPTWPSWPFATFDELAAVADQAAMQAQDGGVP